MMDFLSIFYRMYVYLAVIMQMAGANQATLLLTAINFNPSMDM